MVIQFTRTEYICEKKGNEPARVERRIQTAAYSVLYDIVIDVRND